MMRALALLALLGAAPADITPAATCTLPRAQTEAAFRTLPLLSTEDDTEADERGTIYSFGSAEIWGASAKTVKFSDYANPNTGEYSQRYETAFEADLDTIFERFVAAHGKQDCDRRIGSTCELDLAPDGEWARMAILTLTVNGSPRDHLELACLFTKRR